MKFWIVQAQENPAAPRSTRARRIWRSNALAETLADNGHDVVRWRSAFSHQAKRFLTDGNHAAPHDNYMQRFIACTPYHRHVGVARIRSHLSLARNFTLSARIEPAADLIHVGNVPIELAHAAVRFGAVTNRPVLVDIRDLWPDIYADLLPVARLRPAARALLHTLSWKLKWTLRHATGITSLTEPYLDWALALAGRLRGPADAIFPMCYPARETMPVTTELDAMRARIGLRPGETVLSYLGNIGHQSDFDVALAAAQLLADRSVPVRLVIAGSGPREAELRAAAQDMPNVSVPGWLDGTDLDALLHLSDIGLIAFRPSPNYLLNIPNKFPEYLAAGLAIACGLGGEMGALTDRAGCGIRFAPGDAAGLADGLATLVADPARLDAMKNSARALHLQEFDAHNVFPDFARHLEDVARAGRAQEGR